MHATHVPCAALVLLLAAGVGAAQEPGQAGKLKQEYYRSLKGKTDDRHGLTLIGPDAEECVRFEPEGVRIVLPAGFEAVRPNTGFSTRLALAGDFEITVGFEVLQEPEPEDGLPVECKLHLLFTLAKPPFDLAGFSRVVNAKRSISFSTWLNKRDEAGKFKQPIRWHLATTKVWRFQLSRSGTTLSYAVADGGAGQFRLLQSFPYFGDNLKDIRVVAATGGPKQALDVRVTDLRIRAESLTNMDQPNQPQPNVVPPAAPQSDAPAGSATQSKLGWRVWLALSLLLALAPGLALACWQNRRGPNRAGGSPSVKPPR